MSQAERKEQLDHPERPRFEVELMLRVWKTDKNGRRSEPMVELPARWTDCDDAAVIAIESAVHQLQGRLIQLGAVKALSGAGIGDPDKIDYLKLVAANGPATPLDLPV